MPFTPLLIFPRNHILLFTAYFRYIQLRHTAEAQFGLINVSLKPFKLENVICDPSHNKLVSTYYLSLLHSKTEGLWLHNLAGERMFRALLKKCGRKFSPYRFPLLFLQGTRLSRPNFYIDLTIHPFFFNFALAGCPLLSVLKPPRLMAHSTIQSGSAHLSEAFGLQLRISLAISRNCLTSVTLKMSVWVNR